MKKLSTIYTPLVEQSVKNEVESLVDSLVPSYQKLLEAELLDLFKSGVDISDPRVLKSAIIEAARIVAEKQ